MARTDPGGTSASQRPLRPRVRARRLRHRLVADLHGRRSHGLVRQALTALEHLAHRGATGAEVDTGDGAGILIQSRTASLPAAVPASSCPTPGRYAAGWSSCPPTPTTPPRPSAAIDELAAEEGLRRARLARRPVEPDRSGRHRRARAMPRSHRCSWSRPRHPAARADAARRSTGWPSAAQAGRARGPRRLLRRRCRRGPSSTRGCSPAISSTSSSPTCPTSASSSGLALVHSRFSTNTFPSWPLAHPYRYLAHNGEINTLRGNRNWMRAREALLASDLIPGDLERIFPICTPDASDSATFDEVLELLHLGGRTLPHAVLMMIPEAWENHAPMDPARRAFYRFHASLMEPWDGPAAVVFTDGTVVGGVLDRNGLRPARYWVTDDGLVVLASEVGVLDIDPAKVVRKGRLQPGRMFLVDTAQGRIVDDDEIKAELAAEHPYGAVAGRGPDRRSTTCRPA